MAKNPKAVVFRSTARASGGKRKSGFRFHLKGANGKIIAHGEHYVNKEDLLSVLAKYFAGFDVKDETMKGKPKTKNNGNSAKKRSIQ